MVGDFGTSPPAATTIPTTSGCARITVSIAHARFARIEVETHPARAGALAERASRIEQEMPAGTQSVHSESGAFRLNRSHSEPFASCVRLRKTGSRSAPLLIGVLPLDRPGGRDVADTLCRQDACAVHEPDGGIPAGVAPQEVALAVAVEVAGQRQRPGWDGYVADADSRQNGRSVHQPDRGVAAGVAPDDVGLAVGIEVAGADHRPDRWDGAYRSGR